MRDETSTPLQGQCVRTVEHSLWVNGDKSKSYPRGTARGAAISSFGIANELRTCNASVRMTTGGIRGISRWSAADCVALYACQREKVWIHFADSGVRCNIWVSCRCCFTNTTHFTIRPLAALFAVLDNPLHIRAYLVSIRRRRKQSQNAPIQTNVPIWVLPALASAPGTDWRESQSTLRLPCSFSLYTISMRSSQRRLHGLYQVFLFAY